MVILSPRRQVRWHHKRMKKKLWTSDKKLLGQVFLRCCCCSVCCRPLQQWALRGRVSALCIFFLKCKDKIANLLLIYWFSSRRYHRDHRLSILLCRMEPSLRLLQATRFFAAISASLHALDPRCSLSLMIVTSITGILWCYLLLPPIFLCRT